MTALRRTRGPTEARPSIGSGDDGLRPGRGAVGMTHVFRRVLNRELPMAVSAEGVWIERADGRRYLDGAGGAIVVNVGHGDRAVIDAATRQLPKPQYVHGTMFTTEALEPYADEVAPLLPMHDARIYPVSRRERGRGDGLKLARTYHLARGEERRVPRDRAARPPTTATHWGARRERQGAAAPAVQALARPARHAPPPTSTAAEPHTPEDAAPGTPPNSERRSSRRGGALSLRSWRSPSLGPRSPAPCPATTTGRRSPRCAARTACWSSPTRS